MYFTSICTLFSVVILILPFSVNSTETDDIRHLFSNFKSHHNKKYKDPEEHNQRLAHFSNNHQRIKELNLEASQSGHNVSFKANKFADRSWKEFHSRLSKVVPSNHSGLPVYKAMHRKGNRRVKRDALPRDFDLRDVTLSGGDSLVGPVKNQEECGCCWAFAATAITETAAALLSNEYQSLSEQEICDCADTAGTPGCVGGDPRNGLQFVHSHGQTNDEVYPYEEWRANTTGNCDYEGKELMVKPGVLQVYRFEEGYAEEDIMENLYYNHMPTAVYFKVSQRFEWYNSGIFQSEDCESLNPPLWHSAAIIGYGTHYNSRNGKSIDYWIVRNSWDTDWGEDGYVKVKRGVDWCEIERHPATVGTSTERSDGSSSEEN